MGVFKLNRVEGRLLGCSGLGQVRPNKVGPVSGSLGLLPRHSYSNLLQLSFLYCFDVTVRRPTGKQTDIRSFLLS